MSEPFDPSKRTDRSPHLICAVSPIATVEGVLFGCHTGLTSGTIPSCRPSLPSAPFRSWCHPPVTMPESISRPPSSLGAPTMGSRYSDQCSDHVVAKTRAVPKC